MKESRTQLENPLTAMWARIVGIEHVGLHDNSSILVAIL